MKNCVYKIESLATGKLYIGSTKNVISRKSLHFTHLKKGIHANSRLLKHYKKYGEEDLKFIVLEEGINHENLLIREQFYLDTLKPFFNICKNAGSNLGFKHKKRTKEKIRNSLLGVKHTPERRANMSKASKGRIKKPFTESHKSNISKALTGIKRGTSQHAKPVIKLKDDIPIKEYSSIKLAALDVNCSRSLIIQALTGTIKTAKKYEWKYKQDTSFDA